MLELPTTLPEGFRYFPGYFDASDQRAMVALLRDVVKQAPLYQPVMPRTGTPFSVQMTNCGSLGWVSDRTGYRYQREHPTTGAPWPPMPEIMLKLWEDVAECLAPPEACLVNFYGEGAKMGLHQDRDESTFEAPVVSVSLGDTALFRVGQTTRGGKTQSITLTSGDVIVFGGAARLCYHGISKVMWGSSPLLSAGGRLNLTLRRVTPF
ncbi:alpha-ketoglutarate-dependent dioxygenase AlkB family protein [Pseudovibrio exalbescens]|uniref:alpha-ketoglutarate-dependent dioxygenase AlkB family protein n=1 Tax=Pseudovibrio exalbescens TaxID=197461 RepID=UPI003CC7D261